MKVVLDANIFVSFLLTRGMTISTIINSWKKDSYQLLVSSEILAEFNDIFDGLIRRKLINPITSVVLLNRVNYQAVHVNVTSIVTLSPDKKDNRYLACAKDGHADYLVSGDQHLLQIKKYRQTKIVSPAEFTRFTSC